MNRRNFLSLIAAAPLVAAVPVLAKARDPLGGRRHFANEVIHMYEPLVLDERMNGLHMTGCKVHFHGDMKYILYQPDTSNHALRDIYVSGNVFISPIGYENRFWMLDSAPTVVLQ